MLFSQQRAIIWVMDNCQMGQQLLYLRAKTSSNFVLGTSQLAIEVSEYTNVSFDEMCIDEIIYDGEDQPIPSPDGMPAFEDLIVLKIVLRGCARLKDAP